MTRNFNKYTDIHEIPTFRDYTRFKQFHWLKEKFYTSINFVSKNLGTIFIPPALKIHNYFDKNEILMTI